MQLTSEHLYGFSMLNLSHVYALFLLYNKAH